MSVMSRFPMGAGGKYAEGTASVTLSSEAYAFDITGLEFTPKVVFGSVSTYSDIYADAHKTAAEHVDGTTVKLVATPNGYAANPTYTIGEKSFRVKGYTPPGNSPNYGASISWKAWG